MSEPNEYARRISELMRAKAEYDRLSREFVKGHGDGLLLIVAWWRLEMAKADARHQMMEAW